jgi:hypothetical protein
LASALNECHAGREAKGVETVKNRTYFPDRIDICDDDRENVVEHSAGEDFRGRGWRPTVPRVKLAECSHHLAAGGSRH